MGSADIWLAEILVAVGNFDVADSPEVLTLQVYRAGCPVGVRECGGGRTVAVNNRALGDSGVFYAVACGVRTVVAVDNAGILPRTAAFGPEHTRLATCQVRLVVGRQRCNAVPCTVRFQKNLVPGLEFLRIGVLERLPGCFGRLTIIGVISQFIIDKILGTR